MIWDGLIRAHRQYSRDSRIPVGLVTCRTAYCIFLDNSDGRRVAEGRWVGADLGPGELAAVERGSI